MKYIRGRSQWNCPYWRRDLFGPAVRRSQLIEADTGVANQGAPARVVLLNKSPELLRRSYHGCETQLLEPSTKIDTAGARNPWARRRRVKLAELVAEPWVLPPPDNRLGSLTRDIFDAQELPYPRASVVATALEMTINLLRTDRYLAILPESVFTFPTKHPFIRKLPVELPIVSGPIGILTLKNRVLSPAAQLFVDCARGLAKPLAHRK